MTNHTIRKLLELSAKVHEMGPSPFDVADLISILTREQFESEFQGMGELRQHPDGLSFAEWKARMRL